MNSQHQIPYPRIIEKIRSSVWCAEESVPRAIAAALHSHITGIEKFTGEQPQALHNDRNQPRIEGAFIEERIAIIPVFGIIGKHLSLIESLCGGVDLDDIERSFVQAEQEEAIDEIILWFDSPGGVVTGVPELAERVASAQKRVFAFTDTMMASGAYWLAAGAEGIFATPSANVGSIGTFMAMIDVSEAWQQIGFKLELIKAGSYKAAGIEGSTLTDEQRQLFQSRVNEINDMFTAFVRGQRPSVSGQTMQGQSFFGREAESTGLIDETVSGLETLIQNIQQSRAQTRF